MKFQTYKFVSIILCCCLILTAFVFSDISFRSTALAEHPAWTNIGPYGGDVKFLAIDPTVSSNLYAVDMDGGIFKSADGGVTWHFFGNDLPQITGAWQIGAVAVHPGDSDIVFISVSGSFTDPPSILKSSDGGLHSSILKSSDGGLHWSTIYSSANIQIEDINIDPSAPNTIYAAGFLGGILKSTDGGNHFTLLDFDPLDRDIVWIKIDPQSPSTLYAGSANSIFKSINGGTDWDLLTDSIPLINDVIVNPQSSSIVYALSNPEGVYKSIDGGTTWGLFNNGLPQPPRTASLIMDPASPNSLYVRGADDIFKTTDGGDHWYPMHIDYALNLGWKLFIDPQNPATIYTTGSIISGIHKSTDAGDHWVAINSGLNAMVISSIAVDPQNQEVIYTIAQGNLFRSENRSRDWTWLSPDQGIYLRNLIINPHTPSTLYAWDANHIYKSEDRGARWMNISITFPSIDENMMLFMNRLNPDILYAGFLSGVKVSTFKLLKSVDGGAHWNEIVITGDFYMEELLAIDPDDPNILYAFAYKTGLMKSIDGGVHWFPIQANLPSSGINRLLVEPCHPTHLYALYSVWQGNEHPAAYKSLDGGESWESIDDQLPVGIVNDLEIDPNNCQTIYLVKYRIGTYKSMNAGLSWFALTSEGLSDSIINTLALGYASEKKLYAGTFHLGIFELPQTEYYSYLPLNRFQP